jgi:hypothetical protein
MNPVRDNLIDYSEEWCGIWMFFLDSSSSVKKVMIWNEKNISECFPFRESTGGMSRFMKSAADVCPCSLPGGKESGYLMQGAERAI